MPTRHVVSILCLLLVIFPAASVAHDPLALPVRPLACEHDRLLALTSPLMQGSDVLMLQTRLAELGLYRGALDGVYGPMTQQAVTRLQQGIGLTANGLVNGVVWEALWPQEASPLEVARTPPPEGNLLIEIDTNTLRLTLFADGVAYKTYPVAVGRPSQFTLSPVGEWRIVYKGVDWGGGFGTRWLGLNVPWGIYGIHGTNNPSSIGTRASAGCIRMQNRDVEELYEWVAVGTPVRIIGDPPSHLRFDRQLRSGTSGDDIVFVQLQLNKIGFDTQGADGRFGGNTEAAVRKLQRTYGLPVDGTVYDDIYYILGLR